jgi:glyoxylase-like metal-dependent hydrolase (beta-lactamase superfamily II)
MDTLAQAGVARDAVDTVITTHLHHDHVGWNTIRTASGRLTPTFPNARYLQPVADAGQLDLVPRRPPRRQRRPARSRPGTPPTTASTTTSGSFPRQANTPGHVVIEIANGGQAALLAADLVHHPLQLRRPDISAAMCIDPAASAAGRRKILDRYADTGTYFLASHLPRTGRIHRRGNGYALTPID